MANSRHPKPRAKPSPTRTTPASGRDVPAKASKSEPNTDSPANRHAGRPSALTPAAQERLLAAVRAGASRAGAAAVAGVHAATLYRWLQRGREETTGEFREFCDTLQKATAEAEVALVATMGRIARQTTDLNAAVRAATWLLERRYPQQWGRRERVTHVGDKNAPVVFELRVASPLSRRIEPAEVVPAAVPEVSP